MIRFLKWLFCLEPRQQKYISEDGRLIMNANGSISLNTDNPEVMAGLHKEMLKFLEIKI